jgi:methionine-R-sulfoxide reductase
MNKLSPEEKEVILFKSTEKPFSGEYENFYEDGIYVCRQCDNPLFTSRAKFDANCGWPAFDDCMFGAVIEIPDADGSRTEIICANCKGHLGHVFKGEKFTEKDTRHCVNSLSIRFVKSK